ncbi:Ig-like domain-containing protein [Nocardioides sp. SR21]|uniref:Ig-like domain-containing protein n=1 Tax=Nocardioides sp. SR21 TaxID=2919501 RepID=UPI001FAAEC61|nr:Ig-like domain-containing protein [Nocardioides sp. SR21]
MRRSVPLGVIASIALAAAVVNPGPAAAKPAPRPVASDDRAVILEDAVLRLARPGVLANDHGTGRLRAEVLAEPRGATVRLGARGGLRLRPDADVNGAIRLVYRAVDGRGRTDRAVVRVQVVPVNDAPSFTPGPDQVVAADAGAQVVAGWAADVEAGAPDEHGQQLTFEVDEVSDADLFAAGGLPAVSADGVLTYTPAPGAHGTATARVVLTDDGGEADGGSDTSPPASLRITVSPPAVRPVVRPGGGATAVIAGGSSALLAPEAEVVDPDSELTRATVTVAGGTAVGIGLAATTADGITASYDAGAGRLELVGRASEAAYQRAIRAIAVQARASATPGAHRVLIEIEDVDGLTGRAERDVRVDAAPPADLPTVTVADAVTVAEDTEATGNVLANDTDPDDPLTVTSHTAPAHGTVTIDPDGDYRYTPEADWNGTVPTISYTTNTGAIGALTITVTPVDDAPVATADDYSINEDDATSFDVLANDTDVDDDPLVADLVTNPVHGIVVVNPSGTVTYTPDPNFHGTDSFTYRADDGDLQSSAVTVTVTVDPVEDAPVAHDDSYTTGVDTPVARNVIANDVDGDGDSLVAELVTPPSHGTLVLSPAGSIIYTPDPGYRGTDSFTYAASDGHGSSDSATVTVRVNDPTVTVTDSVSVAEDTQSTGNVLTNDRDPDPDDALTVIDHTDADHGTLAIEPDGDFTYTPDADWHGTETVTYTTNTGATGTLDITVTPVNDAPVAHDDSYTIDEDTTWSLPFPLSALTANDTDVDGDTVSVSSVGGPVNGSFALVGGNLVFIPTAHYSGPASFTYSIHDGNVATATATVNITVTAVDDPTVTVTDSVTVAEDAQSTGNVLTNDIDPDDALTVTDHTDPDHGTLAIEPDGDFTYTPAPDWHGTETATYTTSTGATGTLDITVTPVNDAPVAHDDSYTIDENTTLSLPFPLTALTANDTDVDGDTLSVSSVGSPVNGSLDAVGGNLVFTPTADYSGPASFTYSIHDGNSATATSTVNVTVTAANDAPVAHDDSFTTDEDTPIVIAAADVLTNDSDPDGDTFAIDALTARTNGIAFYNGSTITFTPASDYSGPASFSYRINDGHGATAIATVHITVTPVDDATITIADIVTGAEDTPATGNVLTNDIDPDDTLSVTSHTDPATGTLTIDPDGDFTYTPAPGWSGALPLVTYTTNTGATGFISITVTSVNDAPVAHDDSFTTDEDTPIVIAAADVLTNDSDPDGDTFAIDALTARTNGIAFYNGSTITFTPASGYSGPASFSYRINDGHGGTAIATVHITVTPVDDATITIADIVTVAEDTPATGNVLTNDIDPDDTLSVTSHTDPATGTLTIDPDGDFTYTPAPGWSGALPLVTYTTNTGATGFMNITVIPTP